MGLKALAPASSGAPPTGSAGGDLTGTYPNPTVKASVALTTPDIGAATGTSLTFNAAAGGITQKIGVNGRVGTFTANGATPVAVSNTSIAATDTIAISLSTSGGTGPTAAAFVVTTTAASGFTAAAAAGDTSTYNYAIIKKA